MPRLTNLPNIISIARLLSVPLAVWLIVSGLYPAAFWLFVMAGISDAADGFLARLFNAQTPLGAYIDPLADKTLLVGVYITLGIQGLGNIGTHMARMGNQFGMNVIAWGPTLDAERATKNGATYVSWDELYQQADVLTIPVPLTDLSRGWVTARELGMMKPTAVLINTSRGPIVDRDALLDALQTNKIAGAGIDVYDEEPIQEDNPFLKFDNVVLTPHLGYATIESLRNFYAGAVANINAWLGGEAINVLNEPVNVRGM